MNKGFARDRWSTLEERIAVARDIKLQRELREMPNVLRCVECNVVVEQEEFDANRCKCEECNAADVL